MKIVKNPLIMQRIALKLNRQGKTLGLVPTMGALHEGHLSLIKRARKQNDIVVVSIFVNPKQFGPNEDYLRYPRPFSHDKKRCKENNVDFLFVPEVNQMYYEKHQAYVNVDKISDILCGKSRPGHFKGVATIVAKLLNIVMPQKAYFGIKDYQQVTVIKKMVNDLNFPVRIIQCPIVRCADGLALSSRNQYLSKNERKISHGIFEALQHTKNLVTYKKARKIAEIEKYLKNQIGKISGVKIDYIAVCNAITLDRLLKIEFPMAILLAVWVGKTRLIDNVLILK